MIVLDASILVKWFLQEEDSENALEFKERLLTGQEDIAILPSLFDLGLEIITPSQKLLMDALHLSFATSLSIYDCVYLALARNLGVRLITADRRIVREAESFVSVNSLAEAME